MRPGSRHRSASRRPPGTGRAYPSGRPGSRALDQLPRRRELGLAPVELAVQLPPPQLPEDLPDPRRLAEAEVCDVCPGDLQADASEPAEVLVQGLEIGEREREERRIRGEGLGQR